MEEVPDIPPKAHYKLRPSLKRPSINPLEALDISNEGQNATLAPRRVSFAASAAIKPFVHDPENNTIWDNSYEASIAHTDSNVASLEVVSSVQEFNVIESIIDRENMHVKKNCNAKKRVKKIPLKLIEPTSTIFNDTVLQPSEIDMTCQNIQQEILLNDATIYQDLEMSMTCNFKNQIIRSKENILNHYTNYPQINQPTAEVNGLDGSTMDLTCPVSAAILHGVQERLSDDSSMEVTCNFSTNIVLKEGINTNAEQLTFSTAGNIFNQQKSILSDVIPETDSNCLNIELPSKLPQNMQVPDFLQENIENIKASTFQIIQNITKEQKSILDKHSNGSDKTPTLTPMGSRVQKSILKESYYSNTCEILPNSTSGNIPAVIQQAENLTNFLHLMPQKPVTPPALEDMEVSLELSKFVALQQKTVDDKIRKSGVMEKTWTFEDDVLKSLKEKIKDTNVRVEHFGQIPIAVDSILDGSVPCATLPKTITSSEYNTILTSSIQEKTFDLIQTGQKLTQQEDSLCNMKELLVEDIETQYCDFTMLPNISLEKAPTPPKIKFPQPKAQNQSAMSNITFFQQIEDSSIPSTIVVPTIDELLSNAFENPLPLSEKINLEPFETLVNTATCFLKTLESRVEILQIEQSFDPGAFRLPEDISDLTVRLSMNVTQVSPESSSEKLDDSTVESPDRSSLHKQILKEFATKHKDIMELKRSVPNFYVFSLMYGSVLCSAELHPEDGFVVDFCKMSLLTGEQDLFYHMITLVVGCLMQKIEKSSLHSHLGRHFNMFTLLDFLFINTEKSIRFYNELMDIQRKFKTFRIHSRNDKSILSFNILIENPPLHFTIEFKMSSEAALQNGSLVTISKSGEINEEHIQTIFRNTEPGSNCAERFIDSVAAYFKRMVLPKAFNKLKDMENYVRFKISDRKRASTLEPAAVALKRVKH